VCLMLWLAAGIVIHRCVCLMLWSAAGIVIHQCVCLMLWLAAGAVIVYDIITCWDPSSVECVGSSRSVSSDVSSQNSTHSPQVCCSFTAPTQVVLSRHSLIHISSHDYSYVDLVSLHVIVVTSFDSLMFFKWHICHEGGTASGDCCC